MKLKMLRGLPASGKTTRARQIVNSDGNAGRINRDDLRQMLFAGKWSGPREQIVVDCEKALATVLLKHKHTPIVDDTNLTDHHLNMWKQYSKDNGAEFTTEHLTTNLAECLRRNRYRQVPVPEPVITRMAIQNGLVEIGEAPIAIFDIDGTLADGTHREHFVTGEGKKDWDSYYSQLSHDRPIELVCRWLNTVFDEGLTVVIVSGRPDTYWKETCDWLEYHGLLYHYLLMRKGSDKRQDDIVKQEILDILPKEKIVFVADDRPRVIRMWRANGLRVIPVRGDCEEF